MDLFEKKKNRKVIYSTSFASIYEDTVILPNEKESMRIWVEHLGASAVLPITSDGLIILVKQFRYPLEKVMLEIPAGKKDFKDEDGLLCAKRELEEETSHISDDIRKVMDIHNCVGYSNEMIELYVAYNCVFKENSASLDDDEFVETCLYTKEEVLELLQNNEITDVKTLVMLQWYLNNK